jgi:hypothetical protein
MLSKGMLDARGVYIGKYPPSPPTQGRKNISRCIKRKKYEKENIKRGKMQRKRKKGERKR